MILTDKQLRALAVQHMTRGLSVRSVRMAQKIAGRINFESAQRLEGCWTWQGPCSGNGRGGNYPRMCLDGATVAVHRVVYTLVYGYIPPRKQIDHKCRNRMCVNPEHLEMVTHRENQRRRARAQKEAKNDRNNLQRSDGQL